MEGFEWRNWKILPGAYRAYKRINPEKRNSPAADEHHFAAGEIRFYFFL